MWAMGHERTNLDPPQNVRSQAHSRHDRRKSGLFLCRKTSTSKGLITSVDRVCDLIEKTPLAEETAPPTRPRLGKGPFPEPAS